MKSSCGITEESAVPMANSCDVCSAYPALRQSPLRQRLSSRRDWHGRETAFQVYEMEDEVPHSYDV